MIVGVVSMRFAIPGSHSLKDKRRALRSFKDRLRAQFNVSVAEVGEQDVWQTAELAAAAVGTDRAFVEGLLDQAVALARRQRDAELVRVRKEFVQDSLTT